ncbi:MAG: phosphoethanolamine transferase [Rickettsiaceae bacterium]|nr:phosphoethanolamine transferase [Rickettsiaceae bacterium]
MLKIPPVQAFRTPAIAAFIYGVLFNAPIILLRFSYFKADIFAGILEVTKEFAYIYLSNFILFYGLSVTRFTFFAGSLFLFITGAMASYSVFFFKLFPTKQVIRALFENEISESSELMSIKLILWVLLSIAISIWILLRDKTIHSSKVRILPLIMLAIFSYNIAHPKYKILTLYFPMQYLNNSYRYMDEKLHKRYKRDISEGVELISAGEGDIVGVLVIGESARYDHFSINGYKRKTTPLISKISNLHSFKARSDATVTYLSVPYMLTNVAKENIDEAIYSTTFLSILTKASIDTSWIGTQNLMKYIQNYTDSNIYDEVAMTIIPGGSALFKMNDYDEVILPYLDNILQRKGKKFIVLHTSGSHWNYSMRYPESYTKFSPACKRDGMVKIDFKSCSHEELVNSYDNSIVYTDYILDQIISRLKDKKAFLIYVSDHAESLGEEGRYGHAGNLHSEQTSIPFIFWSSDKFTHHHTSLNKVLKSKKYVELDHRYIFNSCLGCMGIKSSIIDKGHNLCSQ